MLKEGMDGFCIALADSVPGVFGGTVVFYGILCSVYQLYLLLSVWKDERKKFAVMYLAKLGAGWVIGMVMSVVD